MAVGRSLSLSGQDLASRLEDVSRAPLMGEVLVISAFNGIAGAFRAYDLLGLQPAAMISIEIDPAACRGRKWWPHAIAVWT